MHSIITNLAESAPKVQFWSARVVDRISEEIHVRRNLLQPLKRERTSGLMVTVHDGGGSGYAATTDFSSVGLRKAFEKAQNWAQVSGQNSVIDTRQVKMPRESGSYHSPVLVPWNTWSLRQKIDLLTALSCRIKTDDRIVDWETSMLFTEEMHNYITSEGVQIEQQFSFLAPGMSAVANKGPVTQLRSLGGLRAVCRQSGLELLEQIRFSEQPERLANEAIELLLAPNCPSEKMDLLLDPGQMMLQIHESIGHPLELDRILGDERNYAGTSFVTQDMFGSYQYGSPLLNISYDPSISNEIASFAFDDDGSPAQKTFLIREGILQKPLGGSLSQSRAGMTGVANSRACSWNRPPIDRMANLNLEAGTSTFADMVSGIERGIYMKSNTSWSIDDSRNKFQFGCEWAQLIENGKFTSVVRNPNYRGISATFWRNLKKVGTPDTVDVLGTPYCGKGEPNQCVRVGHASPACLFATVDVFGGE